VIDGDNGGDDSVDPTCAGTYELSPMDRPKQPKFTKSSAHSYKHSKVRDVAYHSYG